MRRAIDATLMRFAARGFSNLYVFATVKVLLVFTVQHISHLIRNYLCITYHSIDAAVGMAMYPDVYIRLFDVIRKIDDEAIHDVRMFEFRRQAQLRRQMVGDDDLVLCFAGHHGSLYEGHVVLMEGIIVLGRERAGSGAYVGEIADAPPYVQPVTGRYMRPHRR